MPEITIHDQPGWTQATRRALLQYVLEEATLHFATEGKVLTTTEELDGVTLYVDGVYLDRILWAELAQAEAARDAQRQEGGACP